MKRTFPQLCFGSKCENKPAVSLVAKAECHSCPTRYNCNLKKSQKVPTTPFTLVSLAFIRAKTNSHLI